jgi:hypothetical protein
MVLRQLKKIVDAAMENERNHDLEVVVSNIGPSGVTPVYAVKQGIDHNKHLFVIHPAINISRETKVI